MEGRAATPAAVGRVAPLEGPRAARAAGVQIALGEVRDLGRVVGSVAQQRVFDHERRRAVELERLGERVVLLQDATDFRALHVAGEPGGIEADAPGDGHDHVLIEPGACLHHGVVKGEILALPAGRQRGARGQDGIGSQDGPFLVDAPDLRIALDQFGNDRVDPLAHAAAVVEELDDGNVAARIAADGRRRVVQQLRPVGDQRRLGLLLFGLALACLQSLDRLGDDLRVVQKVVLDDGLDFLLLRLGQRFRRGRGAGRDGQNGRGDEESKQVVHDWRPDRTKTCSRFAEHSKRHGLTIPEFEPESVNN